MSRHAVLLTAVLLAACAGSGGGGGGKGGKPQCKPPATPTVSYASNIQPIYNRSCAQSAGCHAGGVPAQQLDLSLGNSYSATVNVKSTEQPGLLVKPGVPDDSYLVQKIENTPGIAGLPMPQGCPANPLQGAQCLTGDDIAAIRTWITECAPNN